MNPNSSPTIWGAIAGELGNHLWQSTLFAAVVALLALALRKYQARARYWLWLTASVKFLIPFSLLIAAGSHLKRPTHPTESRTSMYFAVDEMSQPFTDVTAFYTPTTPMPVQPTPSHPWIASLPAVLAVMWLCGFFAVLASWYAQWRRVVKIRRKATLLVEGREIEALRRMELAAKIPRQIEILSSRGPMEPGVFGIVHPILLWPEGISQHLDDAHLEAVLAHEVCHVQRRDNLTSAVHMVVEAIFWFYPLVWWMEGRLVEERERACDEEVLRVCHQPQVYAESVLKVCEFCVESPLACVSGVTGADLKRRIVQIMTEQAGRKLDLSRKLLLTVAAVIAVALPFAFGLVHAPQIHAESAPAQDAGITPVKPMAADAHPSFAVATIKPHDPASNSQGFHNAGDRISIRNESITSLMMFAYSINKHQVIDLPAWAETSSYDIEGKTDIAGEPNLRQQQEMIQNLLADRFHLKMHRDQRELPVYAIQVAKGGAKLTAAAKPEDQPNQQGYSHGTEMTQTYTNCSIPNFILGMQFFLDRPVVDQTGLTGHYDFTFHYTADEVHATDPNAPPGLFTAVQEQLGLKFEPTKAPVEVFAIDHLEMPTVDGAEVTQPAASVVPVAMVQEKAAAPAASGSDPKAEDVLLPGAAFDVATFKPSDPNARLMGGGPRPNGTYLAMNQSLKNVICNAYQMGFLRCMGGPGWLEPDRYDIEAKPDSATTEQLLKLTSKEREPVQERMLQALLADRLKLKVHFETREVPIFELVVAKGGLKMHEAQAGDTYANGLKRGDGKPMGRQAMTMGHGNMTGQGILMDTLAANLGDMTGHFVENKTGLTGAYDFTLHSSASDPPPPDSTEPSIYTALEEQLGLKLEPSKGQVQVLVIDHVERPSEN